MLKFGADVICQSAGKQLSDADIDAIVSRSGPSKSESGGKTASRTTAGGKKKKRTSDSSVKGQNILQNQQHSALEYDPVAAPMETR